MYDEHRPDPDALLAAVQHEEAKQQHGKLKIFFGMSAGVGKTYAMLEAAKQRLADGVDVVIGYVETHHRAETEALVTGIPIIPRQKLEYRNAVMEEMDIDAILQRKPQLVLVDELAHTNVEGSRHPKRYQDVLELLASGIDVYTTVNVQHLESRADTVAQITGVIIRETVPDTLIDIASDIELVDLDPDELLKRLAEGKVYTPDRAELASKNFFRKGNLSALREMALRLTAEHVDQQMADYMQIEHIQGPWKSLDRLMVAISPSPFSEHLIRWTRRTAYTLKAPWMAVYVEGPQPTNVKEKAQLARNMSLVRKLGGEVMVSPGVDAASEIMRIARTQNVTQIIVGKPSRSQLQEISRGGSLVNRLIRISGNIDVHVITGDESAESENLPVPTPVFHSTRSQYFTAVLVVIAATITTQALAPAIGYVETSLVMLFMIVLLANFVGRGPIILAAALSGLLMDYLYIPPRFTLAIKSLQDGLILGLYLIIALVTGNLTARLASQKRLMSQREDRTQALYSMSREVAQATTLEDLIKVLIATLSKVFDADVAILLPDSSGQLNEPDPHSTYPMSEKERGVAGWAFSHNQSAGRFTDTLPNSEALYLPLATSDSVAGVIGISPRNAQPFTVDQELVLQTFVSNIALAIERERLHSAGHRASVLEESQRLYTTVLDSISHDLRAPLQKIDAALEELLDPYNVGNPESEHEAADIIKHATGRLKRLVNNLLNTTRLDSDRLQFNIQPADVRLLINESVAAMQPDLDTHELILDIDDNLPLVPMDFALMQQVLENLLQNVVTYTPPNVRVRITAKMDGPQFVLSIADRGPGLPPEALAHIFDQFYVVPGKATRGNGLGLFVCKGIVEAHGGTISAENRPTHGGARFTIRLPAEINTPVAAQADKVASQS